MAGADEGAAAPLGYALAQLHGVFVLAQNRAGLIVVDLHAAHERITYARLKQAHDGEGIRSQPPLVPLALAVSEREAAVVEQRTAEQTSEHMPLMSNAYAVFSSNKK